MYKVISVIFLVALFFFNERAFGQKTLSLVKNGDTTFQNVIDSTAARLELKHKINELKSQGFYAASLTLKTEADTIYGVLTTGKRYSTIFVRKHNLAPEYLSTDKEILLSTNEFQQFQKSLLSNYENNGFPFAQLHLTNTEIANDTLKCDLSFFPYTEILYDTLVYYGKSQLSKKYLARYLDLETGKPYNEISIKAIDSKLRDLPLVRLTRPSQIIFYRRKARVVLYIDDVITDRIDGIVGLAPNSSNSDENNLLLTGELNLELNNLLKNGKQLAIHWRNYLRRSQKLDLNLVYPYLFNTKLGVNGEFNLNKFDTLFLNTTSKLAFRYQKKGNNYVEFYYQNINSSLLSIDTLAIRQTKSIPTNNPYRIANYGLALFYRELDYLPNPRKGIGINADIAIGQKSIIRNQDIRSVKFLNAETNQLISVYDTVALRSLRVEFKLRANSFIPIKKRVTLHQSLDIQGLLADQVFFNELYNFGGYSSLRGFDENELFASKYLRYNLEYRYLIGQNSHVGLFVNAAAIENKTESDELVYDLPYGFGALANIEVGKGILSLAYALGSQQNNPLQLSTAKFHFGIVNYF